MAMSDENGSPASTANPNDEVENGLSHAEEGHGTNEPAAVTDRLVTDQLTVVEKAKPLNRRDIILSWHMLMKLIEIILDTCALGFYISGIPHHNLSDDPENSTFTAILFIGSRWMFICFMGSGIAAIFAVLTHTSAYFFGRGPKLTEVLMNLFVGISAFGSSVGLFVKAGEVGDDSFKGNAMVGCVLLFLTSLAFLIDAFLGYRAVPPQETAEDAAGAAESTTDGLSPPAGGQAPTTHPHAKGERFRQVVREVQKSRMSRKWRNPENY
ncbi:unnamed protein product [Cyprideis torosa]|uniref:Uncharacterized protein n=1 Tax=Cyprideis torosa TaxID=163714 RepID=A0A7R8WCE9_9CRUS|nr:unnamed protein product [Cyprideis torosa]CAG0888355.1 unnamed protein product [Cyprideis torosa]